MYDHMTVLAIMSASSFTTRIYLYFLNGQSYLDMSQARQKLDMFLGKYLWSMQKAKRKNIVGVKKEKYDWWRCQS